MELPAAVFVCGVATDPSTLGGARVGALQKNTIMHALNITMNTEDIVGTLILFTYFVVHKCDVTITLR